MGRAQRWVATPLQLLPWQAALASAVLNRPRLMRAVIAKAESGFLPGEEEP